MIQKKEKKMKCNEFISKGNINIFRLVYAPELKKKDQLGVNKRETVAYPVPLLLSNGF